MKCSNAERTESEIYARMMYFEGRTENNILHIVGCQSTKPLYTERCVVVVWEVENKSRRKLLLFSPTFVYICKNFIDIK